MTVREAIIFGVLAAWFLATLIYQCFTNRLMHLTRRWDIFRVLPSYRLFTEKLRDLRLFYRDRLANEELTDWQEIPLAQQWRWYHCCWNPMQLVPDVCSSLVDDLVMQVERRRQSARKELTGSPLYAGVWQVVRRLPAKQTVVARQFKIARGSGHVSMQHFETCFSSEFHPL